MYTLSATPRTTIRAKDELKKLRIPAVMYGQGVNSQNISLPKTEFSRVYAAAGSSSLVDIAIEGAGTVKAIIKATQVDPRTMDVIHVDLHQVRMDQELTVEVSLKLIGESSAVKVLGGTLLKSIDTVMVKCLPQNLPHVLEVDLSKLTSFDDAITVGSLSLPAGVTIEGDQTLVIAKVAAPLTEEELKKLEESSIGDVTAVKSEAEEKRAAKEAAAAKEAEAK